MKRTKRQGQQQSPSALNPHPAASQLLDDLVELWKPGGRGWNLPPARRAPLVDGQIDADVIAWAALAAMLEDIEDHPALRKSEEVRDFVSALRNACDAGVRAGVDSVLGLLAVALTKRAARAKRASGEDTRQRVLQHWMVDVRAGRPLRGRQARVAKAAKLEPRTVSNAVRSLMAEGLIDTAAQTGS